MKKLAFGILAATLMSAASAAPVCDDTYGTCEGEVSQITFDATGNLFIYFTGMGSTSSELPTRCASTTQYSFVVPSDSAQLKNFYAMALTAQTASKTLLVTAYANAGHPSLGTYCFVSNTAIK